MSESSQPFDGKMFLYEKPVLLNQDAHGAMGLVLPERPYEFVRSIKGLPITASEIQTAQKYYPVVFSDLEAPVLICAVGIIEDRNLFVTDNGNWEDGSYVPAYARCHPFAFARRSEEEFAVIIDESSDAISATPEIPFFDGEDLSEAVQTRVDFCGRVNEERQRTQAFCDRVKELGLLNGQRVTQKNPDGSESRIADYVTIDASRVNELDSDVLLELHRDGSLAAIFAQLFSLENWNRLIARRAKLLAN